VLADHALVQFTLPLEQSRPDVQYVNCRAWRQLSCDSLAGDLVQSQLCRDLDALEYMSVDDLVQLYDQQLSQLVDRHCPEVTVRRRNKQATPWFDADCRSARRRARAAERRFRRTRSDTDKQAWSDLLRTMRLLYQDKCNMYWKKEIDAWGGNMKKP